MKILFLNHSQENYGTYHRCFLLAENLAKRGLDITMICASGKKVDWKIRHRAIAKNFKLITLPRFKYGKYFTGQLWRMVLSIGQVLVYDYDILHAFTVAQPQIGLPAWIAKKIRRKPLVVDWDDLWGGGFADQHPAPIRQVLTAFEQRIPRVADQVTYVSEYLGRCLRQIGIASSICTKIENANGMKFPPEEFQRIHPEKDNFRRSLGIPLDAKLAVSVGNTYIDKTFILLFNAITAAVTADPQIALAFVGQVIVSEQLKNHYRKLFDRRNVILAGSMPFEKTAIFTTPDDILVLPMSDDPIEKARFPMRLGDYLRANRAVVATDVGEVGLFLKKHQAGLLSNPHDAAALGRNIVRLLQDVNLRENLRAQAITATTGELNWDNISRKLQSVYRKI